jgi:hypothetical protein
VAPLNSLLCFTFSCCQKIHRSYAFTESECTPSYSNAVVTPSNCTSWSAYQISFGYKRNSVILFQYAQIYCVQGYVPGSRRTHCHRNSEFNSISTQPRAQRQLTLQLSQLCLKDLVDHAVSVDTYFLRFDVFVCVFIWFPTQMCMCWQPTSVHPFTTF